MKAVEPKVYLVGESALNLDNVDDFLDDTGNPEWTTDAPSFSEELIEIMGRNCYKSFKPGDNPNVTKVRNGNEKYLRNILESGHGSVLEHATLNFIFTNVSRVLTHELVRHRVGTAISQESLRFVRLDEIGFWTPSCFDGDEWAEGKILEAVTYLEGVQRQFSEHYKLDEEKDFHRKKTITSGMRRLAPIGLSTTIGWSCNARALYAIIQKRTHPAAEEEIRLVFSKVAEIVMKRFPNIYGSLEEVDCVDGLPYYRSEYGEV